MRRVLVIGAALALLMSSILIVAVGKRSRGLVRPAAASAKAPSAIRADGRVVAEAGADVHIGAELGGTIAKVHVARGEVVKKGQLLAELDRSVQMAALEEAWAETGEARARFKTRLEDHQQSERLAVSGAVASNEVKRSATEKAAARARLAASGASWKKMAALVEKTRVVSTIDGVVVERNIDPGETVAVGTPLFRIVDLARLCVRAEVDEFYLGHLTLGSTAEVRAEAFAGRVFAGSIVELGDAVVPRALKPLDPARPADVGVLPVRVSLPPGHPLKLGQRVELSLGS
jgi:HlyD family secretion protein